VGIRSDDQALGRHTSVSHHDPTALVPATARVEGDAETWPDEVAAALTTLPPGHSFTVPENLFAKISDEAREELEARFAGV